MIQRRALALATLVVGAALAGCSAGGNSTVPSGPTNATIPTTPSAAGINGSGLSLAKTITIPQWKGATGTYDISQIDPQKQNYYLADRTSNALDVATTTGFGLTAQIPGPYAGVNSNNDKAGPDGVVYVPGTNYVYVGDVDSVKVVDVSANQTVATVATPNGGFRSDEGCYDKDDGVLMFASPVGNNIWIIAAAGAASSVRGVYHYAAPVAGLEQCIYDPGTRNFFLNDDGTVDASGNPTAPHPLGSLDVIPAITAAAGAPVATPYIDYSKACFGPTGLALGPGEQAVVGCDAPAGMPQQTLVVSLTSGKINNIISQVGGSDMVAYDSHFNRYYTASRRWTASGISATPAGPFTPVIGVINAANNAWIANIPGASGVHSVAVDANNGNVWVPAVGGINVYTPTNGTF